tara:strand:- start:19389 stop:20132 length:744 start_codon:yes stop_codon:yes gene_type:complete
MARIAIIGTANIGKSTLVDEFIKTYKTYKTPNETYRDIIEKNDLDHSSNGNQDSQKMIIDFLNEQISKNEESNIIFDRCVIDALIYTMYIADKNNNIDADFVTTCINLCRESTKNLDLVFYIKRDESIKVVDDGLRDIQAIEEVGNIFEVFYQSYLNNYGKCPWFPTATDEDGWPPIIELKGTTKERMEQISYYIAKDGRLVAPSDEGISGIITDYADINNVADLDDIINQQHQIIHNSKPENIKIN